MKTRPTKEIVEEMLAEHARNEELERKKKQREKDQAYLEKKLAMPMDEIAKQIMAPTTIQEYPQYKGPRPQYLKAEKLVTKLGPTGEYYYAYERDDKY